MSAIVGDLPGKSGDVILLVNGFGGTPLMELYLVYESARKQLEKHRFKAARSLVGNYVTSLDMAGCSLTVSFSTRKLCELWDAPVHRRR